MNNAIPIDLDLLERTIRDLTEVLDRLHKEREAIDSRINELSHRIDTLRGLLSKITTRSGGKKRRLRKGQGDAVVSELFDSLHRDKGFSMVEIKEQTGIPLSSVSRILRRSSAYTEGEDRLWRKKGLGEKTG